MSFILVAGLSARCPECGAARQIQRPGGPAPMQVGDENVWAQAKLQGKFGTQGQALFHLEAWCKACAAPILVSEPQTLAEELNRMLNEISGWSRPLRLNCLEKIVEDLTLNTGTELPDFWLQNAFPALYQECFEDTRCGLYPDFFTKMKKRFRTQASRSIERDGVPLSKDFGTWLTMEVSNHPFDEVLKAFKSRIELLTQTLRGP